MPSRADGKIVEDALDWEAKDYYGAAPLTKYAVKHPKAQAALTELAEQSLPRRGGCAIHSIRLNPTEETHHVCTTRRRNLQQPTLTATTRWMLIMKPASCSLMRPVLSRKEITSK